MDLRLALPRAPEPSPPFRFPIVAALAPVVVSLAIWIATGSTFALLFAALGPVAAVAAFVDSKIGARRTQRRELKRFREQLEATRAEVRSRHSREREARLDETPDARAIVEGREGGLSHWRAAEASAIPVTLGRGTVPSTLELDHPGDSPELAELVELASRLERAPIVVDARLGIGICGTDLAAHALARSLAVQLAHALSPGLFRRSTALEGDEAQWLLALPHLQRAAVTRGAYVEFAPDVPDSQALVVAVASTASALPSVCRVVVHADAVHGAEIVTHPERSARGAVHPVLVSREQALDWAQRLTRDATREGLATTQAALPHAAALAPLLRPADSGGDTSLACEVALAHGGPVTVDLVEHGPHAVVGGTTGSGKSELLIAWVLSMAAAHPPERVTFLLVDFKGGSAFSSLGVLPHTVGIITDLHGEAVSRALESLRAEVRYRERLLTEQGARSIDAAEGLPRLVIVVDEFAAMIADHPDLHTLFADLAARGRSLGIHLVLCTQRPAGIVRDAVLANADIRISLRVNNRADSAAVVGVDTAAEIPAGARGRGILRVGGGEATLVQFAMAAPHDAAAVAARWSSSPAPRRPWCEPLGAEVSLDELELGEGLAFGLVDLPGEQRRETAHFVPSVDGHLLVLGAAGSGKSTALAALGRGATWIPNDVGAAWDAVSSLAADTLVILDDLDSLVSRFGAEHRSAFVERLGVLLRDGPVRGIHVVLGAQRLTPDTQSLAALVPSRLMLRHSSRHDWVIAGGDGTTFVESLPAGGGVWKGNRVQVAHVAATGAAPVTEPVPTASPPLAIATTRLAEVAALLPEAVNLADTPDPLALFAAKPGSVLVGDIDEWQSRWGVLGSIRPVADVILHGCSVSDFRVLTRSRQLPPPIAPDQCWLVHLDGTASRVRLPAAASAT